LKRFDVYLKTKVTKFAIYLHEIPVREDIGLRHNMTLASKAVSLMLGVLFSPSENKTALRSSVQSTNMIAYAKMLSNTILDSSVSSHSEKFVNDLKHSLTIRSGDAVSSAEVFTGAEEIKMTLKSLPVAAEVGAVTRFSHRFTLSSSEIGSFVDKFASVAHNFTLATQLHDTVIKYAQPTPSQSTLTHSVRTALSKFRLFSDMDDLPLSYFDGMVLQDVDFIEID